MSVHGGKVAVADHAEGRDFYRLLDLATGRQRWCCERVNSLDLDYGSAPRATPLWAAGSLFVLGAGGDLLCLDPADGRLRWMRNLLADFGPAELPTWGYCGSPLMADHRLIVNPGVTDAAVVALDPANGSLLWAAPGAAANYSSFLAGRWGGVSQVVGYDQRGLCGWAADSGRPLWRVATGLGKGYIVPTPLAWDGKLIAAHEKGAECYGFQHGGVIDSRPRAFTRRFAPSLGTPTLTREWLLGHDNRRLVALSLQSDWIKPWEGPADRRHKGLAHVVAQEDGLRAVVFCQSGWALLVDLSGPEPAIVEQRQLTETTWAHPAVLEGALVCRDRTAVYCYETTGT